jgi:hypothetical protein
VNEEGGGAGTGEEVRPTSWRQGAIVDPENWTAD